MESNNTQSRQRGKPQTADPQTFIERHRARSRAYYKKTAHPTTQCDFIKKSYDGGDDIRCTTRTRAYFADAERTIPLKAYCARHRHRDEINTRNATKDIMGILD